MIALGLLTVAAACHAGWNLVVKSSEQQGPEFVWLCAVVTAPVSVAILCRSTGPVAPALVSMLLHTVYGLVLQKAYAAGDFTVVYPVSRGTIPVLVMLAAIPWTGWPGARAWCGVGLVVCGVFAIDRVRARPGVARGTVLGLAVATCSFAYTLWDAFAVTRLGVEVLPYLAVGNLGQVALLSPIALRRPVVLSQWRRAVLIAALVPASYGLVLAAMSLEPVGAVATGRTLNVVLGTLLGVLVLRERLSLPRVAGLVAVVAGVLLVSAGGSG